MEKEINSDIIIVGGGIAGILTAFSLLKYDPSIKLTLIDNQFHAAAWRIAAGIINPVAGKRIVKTANIDLLMSALLDCNAALHYQTGKHYFFSMPIVRVFRDQSEQLSWDKKIQKEDYHAWLSPYSQTLLPIHTPYGAGIIHGGGRLDIIGLIHDIKAWLSTQCTILHNTFHQEISFSSEQTIIMCYGWEMMYNPYWSWLPFAPFKGEVLTVKMPSDFSSTFILNNGTYFLPLTNGTARIGATIEHDALTYTPTEQARQELVAKIGENIKLRRMERVTCDGVVGAGTRARCGRTLRGGSENGQPQHRDEQGCEDENFPKHGNALLKSITLR